jgi:hypothetical protein
MSKWRKAKQLKDSYRFCGFYPSTTVIGVFGDHKARVVQLTRREKKRHVARVAARSVVGTIASNAACAICPVATHAFISTWKYVAWTARAAAP